MTAATPDFAAITDRQRAGWGAGDFNVIALQTMSVADALCAALDPRAGQRVLDIACGSGNAALVAARRNCDVAGIDYVASLVERARVRAAAEGTAVDFREADAQKLPFPDASFDVVLSVFGVMFAPDQEKSAAEMLRVTKPGGRIGLATWMPEGFGGDFFRTIKTYAPPPEGLKPGTRWGTGQGLHELIGAGTSSLDLTRQSFTQHFRSMDHLLDVFFRFFGPIVRAMETLDAAGRESLRRDVTAVFAKHNRAKDGTVAMECEYMRVVATRK